MLQFIRANAMIKITWIFMAVHLLNMSVDVADDKCISTAEAVQFNEWDSLMELVLEGAIGVENAFEESSSDEDPNPTTFKLQQFLPHSTETHSILTFSKRPSPNSGYRSPDLEEGFGRTVTPPPQV
ncbi:MAG: hypothetical protein EP346_00735 [Bacteroidetes bacterium]|nr:MAG: hypothetical protein EP346_00735 [Bacteroidota bacterium]